MKKILLLLTAMVFATGAQADRWNNYNGPETKATAASSANATAKQLQAQHQNQSQQQYVGNNNNVKAYGGQGGQGGIGIGQGGDANSNAHASGGDAYAKGGNAGALAGSNSGGNSQDTNINVQGDEAAAASAISGQASECVQVLAAQATGGGFSIGGIDGDCRAAIAADNNWELYFTLDDVIDRVNDPEKRAMLVERQDQALMSALDYTEMANPSAFKVYMSGTRAVVTDSAITLGTIAAFVLLL